MCAKSAWILLFEDVPYHRPLLRTQFSRWEFGEMGCGNSAERVYHRSIIMRARLGRLLLLNAL